MRRDAQIALRRAQHAIRAPRRDTVATPGPGAEAGDKKDTPSPRPAQRSDDDSSETPALPDGFSVVDGKLHYKGRPFNPERAINTIKQQRESEQRASQQVQELQAALAVANSRITQYEQGRAQEYQQAQEALVTLQGQLTTTQTELADARLQLAEAQQKAAQHEEVVRELSGLAQSWVNDQVAAWPESVKKTYAGDENDIVARLKWVQQMKPLADELLAKQRPTVGNGPNPTAATGTPAAPPSGANGNRRIARQF